MILESESRRQFGEEGRFILWRDSPSPGRREGLACTLSMCPHPRCACQDVHVRGFIIDAQPGLASWDDDGVHFTGPSATDSARSTPEERRIAVVDPNSGESRAHRDLPDVANPALLDWLASEMDLELLEVLHRYRARAKGYPPEGPRKDIDLDEVEQDHLVPVEELLEGARSDEYIFGDRRYYAALFLCPTPWCDCHEAQVVFFDDAVESGDAVGFVLLDISGPSDFKIIEKTAECEPKQLLEDVWALFEQRHDGGRFLRHREAQLKEVGDTLWHRVPKPATTASNIGRNAPCPCGSGKKYKKCCQGKPTAPLDVGSAPSQ